MTPALALPVLVWPWKPLPIWKGFSAAAARVEEFGTRRVPDYPDDELTAKVEALRRLSPVKARLLGLIADEMLREAEQ